jgi:hypothetical protein
MGLSLAHRWSSSVIVRSRKQKRRWSIDALGSRERDARNAVVETVSPSLAKRSEAEPTGPTSGFH